jgi:hypothetical protein
VSLLLLFYGQGVPPLISGVNPGTVALTTVTVGSLSITAKTLGSFTLVPLDYGQCIPGSPYCHPLQAIPSANVTNVTLTPKTVGSIS